MSAGKDERKPRKGSVPKATGLKPTLKGSASKARQIERRNEERGARNQDLPGQGRAGTRHIDAPEERDRGPVGTDGRGAPGHSKPGRR